MLVNQLYDENQAISMIALSALNEAVDDKVFPAGIFAVSISS